MARPEKEKKVEEIENKISKAKCCIVTDYRGLDVENITELRAKIRKAGGEYQVVKNTLSNIAAKKIGIKELDEYLTGPTAIAFDFEDEAGIAKVIFNFAKKSENLKIKGGVLGGHEVIGPAVVEKLAKLPGRQEALTQLASALQGPLSNLVSVLNGNLQKLVSVFSELVEKKKTEAKS